MAASSTMRYKIYDDELVTETCHT